MIIPMKIVKGTGRCLYKAAVNLIEHDGVEHAGYMAFLSLLSLFPFMVFMVALSGFIGKFEIGEKLIHLFLTNVPENISIALRPRIDELLSGPPQELITLALFGVIWTASSSVEGIRTILNRVYRVTSLPPYLFRRMLSILQFLLISLIIFIATLLLIVVPILWDKIVAMNIIGPKLSYMLHMIIQWGEHFSLLRYILFFMTMVVAVSACFYMIPNVRLKKLFVVPGAVLVVVLWYIGGSILSLYVNHFQQLSLVYGSLAGVIVSLIFFYIMNLIFIYGAEFNFVFGSMVATHRKQQNSV